MIGELVFHLGDPKTGSTTIQETLATGAFRAPGRRVLYPARLHHLALAKTFYVSAEADRKPARMAELARAVAASDADVGIVSAEIVEHVDPADRKPAIETWLPALAGRVRLVAYVRPHAERLVSAWAEKTKPGASSSPLEAFVRRSLARGLVRYPPRLEGWRAVFGDALTLRPMIRDRLRDGDVVADVLGFALRGGPVEVRPGPPRNAAPSCQDLAVLREFHRLARARRIDARVRLAFGWHFARTLAAEPPPGGGRLRLHRALAEDVAAACEADAGALAAAPARAGAAPQPVDTAALLGPERLRLTRAWAELTLGQIEAGPASFMRRLRRRQLRELGLPVGPSPESLPESPPAAPMPRRLARGVCGRLGRFARRVRA